MNQRCTKHIGILSIDFFIPHAQSLKDKRMVIKSIKDRVRNKFNVSVAELDRDDKWQTSTCGISMIGNDRRYIDGCLQNILSRVESMDAVQVSDYQIEFL